MPQLPTADALGAPPAPQPQVVAPTLQTGAVGAAMQTAGEALVQIDEHLTRARRATDLTNALGAATEELGTKAIEYSRDQDYRTAPTRFKADAISIGKRFGDGIADPIVRNVFANEYTKLAVSKQLGVVVGAAKQESDANEAKLDTALQAYSQQYATAANDMERATILNLAKIAIGENVTAGWITDVRGQAKAKQFAQHTDQAVALNGINTDAEGTYKKLSSDPSFLAGLDPVVRQQLTHTAEVRSAQNDAAIRRAKAEIEENAREAMFQDYAKGKLSATQVAQSQAATGVKEHYLNLLKAQAAGAEAVDNVAVKRDLWSRIYLPYGDPNKLTDTKPINDAALAGKLSEKTFSFLRNELINSRTDEGAKLMPDVHRAIQTGHAMLSRSLVGSIQADVAIEAGSRFESDLMTKVSEYQKQNKDPRLLITPGTPDYVLDPKRVASFMPSAKQALTTAAGQAVAKEAPKTADGKVDSTAVLAEARAALAKGANRAAVEARLKALNLSLDPAPANAKSPPIESLGSPM